MVMDTKYNEKKPEIIMLKGGTTDEMKKSSYWQNNWLYKTNSIFHFLKLKQFENN